MNDFNLNGLIDFVVNGWFIIGLLLGFGIFWVIRAINFQFMKRRIHEEFRNHP